VAEPANFVCIFEEILEEEFNVVVIDSFDEDDDGRVARFVIARVTVPVC
jgi:hypothetical protein